MMKVYICPNCGWIRAVSRRSDVECFKCGGQQMKLTRMSYRRYAFLDEEERKDYAKSWLYIHQKR